KVFPHAWRLWAISGSRCCFRAEGSDLKPCYEFGDLISTDFAPSEEGVKHRRTVLTSRVAGAQSRQHMSASPPRFGESRVRRVCASQCAFRSSHYALGWR